MKFAHGLSALVGSMALLGLNCAAQAVPITYTFHGIGTGVLGSQTFTDVEYLFTLVSDTSGVTFDPGSGVFFSAPAKADFTITGIGSGQTTSDAIVGYQDLGGGTGAVGLIDNTAGTGFVGLAPIASGYALNTNLGPTLGGIGFAFPLSTTQGDFFFTDNSTMEFSSVASIPEPAFYQMSGLAALGGIGLLRARRRK